jgi:hypothetical protein
MMKNGEAAFGSADEAGGQGSLRGWHTLPYFDNRDMK